jgi:hypothetical protein
MYVALCGGLCEAVYTYLEVLYGFLWASVCAHHTLCVYMSVSPYPVARVFLCLCMHCSVLLWFLGTPWCSLHGCVPVATWHRVRCAWCNPATCMCQHLGFRPKKEPHTAQCVSFPCPTAAPHWVTLALVNHLILKAIF